MAVTHEQSAQGMSFEMAEDTMDVVSEYDHAGDNEDIDIDIDLTTAQVDEDTMIDDLQSEADVQDRADLMVEDDQASYHMDDINDQAPAESYDVHIDDIQILDLVEDDNPNHNAHVIFDPEHPDGQRDTDALSDIGWDEPELPVVIEEHEPKQEALTEAPTVSEAPIAIINSPVVEVGQEHEILESGIVGSTDGKVSASPSQATPEASAIPEVEHNEAALSNGTVAKEETPDLQGNQAANLAMNVIILYNNTEYALIASAETDDPDNFFFKDSSLTYDTLGSLLGGLRQVLENEVPEGNELCLTIVDLGIQIRESTAHTFNCTFAELNDLHAQLLINDGATEPSPLCVTLGTKPDYVGQLDKLRTGASSGKGLSEFTLWDGQDDSFGMENEEDARSKQAGVEHNDDLHAQEAEGSYEEIPATSATPDSEESPQIENDERGHTITPGKKRGLVDEIHDNTDSQPAAQMAQVKPAEQPLTGYGSPNEAIESLGQSQSPRADETTGEEDIIDYEDDGDATDKQEALQNDSSETRVDTTDSLIFHDNAENVQEDFEDKIPQAFQLKPKQREHETEQNEEVIEDNNTGVDARDLGHELERSDDGAQVSNNANSTEVEEVDEDYSGETSAEQGQGIDPDLGELDLEIRELNGDEIDYEDPVPDIVSSKSESTLAGDELISHDTNDDAGGDEINYEEDEEIIANHSLLEEVSGKRARDEIDEENDSPQQDLKRVRA